MREEDLEELIFPQEVAPQEIVPGSKVSWGGEVLSIEDVFPRRWYKALGPWGEVLLKPGEKPIWAEAGPHVMLPELAWAGPEGYITRWTQGEPLQQPLSWEEARELAASLLKLVRFYQANGFSVIDVDPDHIVKSSEGLKLRIPPRVCRIGESPPSVYREGITPPEILLSEKVSGKEGVYVVSALLYRFVTGKLLPEEGPSFFLLADLPYPGLPQLMALGLAPSDARPEPKKMLELVRELSAGSPPLLRVGAATTVGRNPARLLNEDSYAFAEHVLEASSGRIRLLRACVADGMGGLEAGEVASRAAVESFISSLPPHPIDSEEAQAEWTIKLAWKANSAVLEALGGRNGGCTFTGLVAVGSRVTICHVGDTRAYHVSNGSMRLLTRDHSLAAALVSSGLMTEEEARSSPDKNMVLRSLGSLRNEQPEYIEGLEVVLGVRSLILNVGDSVMLVSDGVWGELDDRKLEELAAGSWSEPQEVAEAIISETIRAGASDNATVLIVSRIR